MKTTFLEFEQPVAELETKIEELRYVQSESAVDISEEIERLDKKSLQLTKDIYTQLTPWQVTQIARHPQRAAGSPRHMGDASLEAGIGTPQAEVEPVREIGLQGMDGQLRGVQFALDRQRVQADAATPAQTAGFGAAGRHPQGSLQLRRPPRRHEVAGTQAQLREVESHRRGRHLIGIGDRTTVDPQFADLPLPTGAGLAGRRRDGRLWRRVGWPYPVLEHPAPVGSALDPQTRLVQPDAAHAGLAGGHLDPSVAQLELLGGSPGHSVVGQAGLAPAQQRQLDVQAHGLRRGRRCAPVEDQLGIQRAFDPRPQVRREVGRGQRQRCACNLGPHARRTVRGLSREAQGRCRRAHAHAAGKLQRPGHRPGE